MMHQQLLEKAQSKYFINRKENLCVENCCRTASLGLHLFHKCCPLKVCFLCIYEPRLFSDVVLPIEVLLNSFVFLDYFCHQI